MATKRTANGSLNIYIVSNILRIPWVKCCIWWAERAWLWEKKKNALNRLKIPRAATHDGRRHGNESKVRTQPSGQYLRPMSVKSVLLLFKSRICRRNRFGNLSSRSQSGLCRTIPKENSDDIANFDTAWSKYSKTMSKEFLAPNIQSEWENYENEMVACLHDIWYVISLSIIFNKPSLIPTKMSLS